MKGGRRFVVEASGYVVMWVTDSAGGAALVVTAVDCIGFEGPEIIGWDGMVVGMAGVRNSIGARSEVRSTVMDRPCVRVVGISCCACWVVGVETTRFGGVP